MQTRYRLIKPSWGKPTIRDRETGEWVPNPDFVKEIPGQDVLEGYYDAQFVRSKNDEGYNIYYFPNHPSKDPQTKFLNGKDIDQFNCVFLDMDLKDAVYKSKNEFLDKLKQFPIPPSRTVDSGHGIHAYWDILKLDRDEYILTQLMLIEFFRTDESVWTPLQLMRCPGYKNTKNPHKLVYAQHIDALCSKKKYETSEIWQHLPPPSDQAQQKFTTHVDKLEGRFQLLLSSAEFDSNLPKKFIDLMEKDSLIKGLFEDPKGTYGDRSGADFSLCNRLLFNDFDSAEALSVIYNTLKARSRQSGRYEYAFNIVEKIYGEITEYVVPDAWEALQTLDESPDNEPVKGPYYMDCLEMPWSKSHILGLVAGTGAGKTALTLSIFKHMIYNNEDNEDLFFFFSLEMPKKEVLDRWLKMVGRNKKFFQRLHVIDAAEYEEPIGYQEIYNIVKNTCKRKGKKVASVAIDHIQALSPYIDTFKKPTFGFKQEDTTFGRFKVKSMTPELKCRNLKKLSRALNCFLIVQNQTTKARGQDGDVPLDTNAGYGTAEFEWICDYVMTVWQPLKRVYDRTDLRITAWRYVKIRHKGELDRTQERRNHLLYYDLKTNQFRRLEGHEEAEYHVLKEEADEIRRKEKENKGVEYVNSPPPLTPEDLQKIQNLSAYVQKS